MAKQLVKKPGWVPDEVWCEYSKSRALLEYKKKHGGDIHGEKLAEIFGKIVADKACADVWPVACSRSDDSTIDSRHPLRSAPYFQLIWDAYMGLKGPCESSVITTTERKDRAEKIIKLAKQLKQELLYLGNKGAPAKISGPLGDRLHNAYEVYALGFEQATDERQQQAIDALGRMKAGLVVHDLFFRDADNSILSSLETAAKDWAKTKPYAHHTRNKSRVKRDYFIRKMTEYFHSNFKKPHRQLVANLTQCLMGIVVTASEVTKIAPVEMKAAKNSKKSPSSRIAKSR